MGFFEQIIETAAQYEDAAVISLTLGWHASFVVSSDGRWGMGCVPSSLKEPHTARESHTNHLLRSSLVRLAELIVSPFPQEFAAATAACSALMPFPDGGFRLDDLMPCARGDRVAVLGYERELIPMMRDWGWKLAVFDDMEKRPDCFPQKDFPRGAEDAEWVWLSPEAIRDRWLISVSETLHRKKGCFLQGPGLPWIKEAFSERGVTHLISPAAKGEAESIRCYLSAGGSPWRSPDLEWKVYSTS